MAKFPLVAIVGRPNVGKSTLFNKLAGKRIAIVEDLPGVTRDRIYVDCDWCGHKFTLVDTGGIDTDAKDEISQNIVKQADIAVSMSDIILYMVDGKQGLVPADKVIADRLRRAKKKVILVVNKLDDYKLEQTYDFYSLGLGEPIGISAGQERNIGDLLDKIVEYFPKNANQEEDNDVLKIAIVGKPNAGKSSIINKLVGEERVIVSNVAGTTRDAIDIPFTVNKKKYLLVDTAGMRRKSKVEDETIERYSIFRTLDAVRTCDVAVLVIDASVPISDQDLKIAMFINSEQKPCVIVMNKWDLIEKDTNTINKFKENMDREFAFMSYYKSIFVSALTGKRLEKLIATVDEVKANAERRVKTGEFNDLLQEAFTLSSPPAKAGKRLKIYYATQTGVCPPTFTLFVNDIKCMTNNYLRYLENCIRKSVDFSGTPIKIELKARKEEDI